MEFFDAISRAFDIGGQTEVVFHESLVQEWLAKLEAMRGSGSVDSKNVELIQLVDKAFGFESSLTRVRLLLEVDVALSNLVGTFTRVNDHIISVVTNVAAQYVHRGGSADRSDVKSLRGIDNILNGIQAIFHFYLHVVMLGADMFRHNFSVCKVWRAF